MTASEPMDLVYTWVDDSFLGYRELLNQYVADKRDTNPNRTRDNLDLIRFSMRSVAQNLPGIRKIFLLSCRPQVPAWLDADHPMIEVVHHDQIMDAGILPTFSSFGIVSHLHRLPGLSRRFLYFEDDMLAMSPDLLGHLQAADGRPVVNLGRHWITPRAKLNPETSSPWNLALSNIDIALSREFEDGPRRHIIHGPQLIDRDVMAEAEARYADLFAVTRANRFRSGDAIPPEVFVPHYALATGQAVRASDAAARRVEGYASIENFLPLTWWQLKRLERRKPLSITLNDSFGDRPNPRVVGLVRDHLNRWFPTPAPFERV